MIEKVGNVIETAAKETAGNWLQWRNFSWANSPDPKRFGLIPVANRDSDLVTRVNRDVLERELSKFEGSVSFGRSRHWLCGWVDNIEIEVYDEKGNITPAFRRFFELMNNYDEYPILDEDWYFEREHEECLQNWEEWGYRDAKHEIGSRVDVHWIELAEIIDEKLGSEKFLEWLRKNTSLDTSGEGYWILERDWEDKPEAHGLVLWLLGVIIEFHKDQRVINGFRSASEIYYNLRDGAANR